MRSVKILQGIPGSGKSYYACQLCAKHVDTALVGIVSADNFWDTLAWKTGKKYWEVYNPMLLSKAHNECLQKFLSILQSPVETDVFIVVDNTNTTIGEIAPYWALADAFGYDIEIIRCAFPVQLAAARNSHGVSLQAILNIQKRIDNFIPMPWWKIRTVNMEWTK